MESREWNGEILMKENKYIYHWFLCDTERFLRCLEMNCNFIVEISRSVLKCGMGGGQW